METRGFRRPFALALVVCVLLPALPAGAAPTTARWQTCGRFVEIEAVTTPGAYWTRLWDVAHLSTHDAWAVGYQFGNDLQGPLALHWDGWRWHPTRLPSKGPAMRDAILDGGVTAIAPDDVWAVGFAGGHPLALHWDGRRWSRTPQPTGLRGELEGIAPIPGTRSLLAVGGRATPGDDQPLVERWNGTAWRVVPTPRLPFGGSLDDVVSFGEVAYATGTRGAYHPFAMRWNGGTWRPLRVPHGRREGSLGGVDGTGPGRVWFVGGIERFAGEDRRHGVILRWNDGALRVVKLLDRASGLSDVTVASPTSIWAVGGVLTGGVDTDPIVLRRTSGPWTFDPAPTVEAASGGFSAVDGTPHDLWAVSQDAGEGPASYLLHRC